MLHGGCWKNLGARSQDIALALVVGTCDAKDRRMDGQMGSVVLCCDGKGRQLESDDECIN